MQPRKRYSAKRQQSKKKGKILGGYFAVERYAGFVTSNARDARDFTEAIRHEVLGHFGLNTFKPVEKSALIGAIMATRGQPSLSKLWSYVDRSCSTLSESFKAEEIFCRLCEETEPDSTVNSPGAERVFHQVITRSQPVDIYDLSTVAVWLANDLLKSRERIQQTFPRTNQDQWKQAVKVAAPTE